jgi:hypothetical protein
VADVEPGPDLDDPLAVDLRHVGISVVLEDGQLARESPVEEMVVELHHACSQARASCMEDQKVTRHHGHGMAGSELRACMYDSRCKGCRGA